MKMSLLNQTTSSHFSLAHLDGTQAQGNTVVIFPVLAYIIQLHCVVSLNKFGYRYKDLAVEVFFSLSYVLAKSLNSKFQSNVVQKLEKHDYQKLLLQSRLKCGTIVSSTANFPTDFS